MDFKSRGSTTTAAETTTTTTGWGDRGTATPRGSTGGSGDRGGGGGGGGGVGAGGEGEEGEDSRVVSAAADGVAANSGRGVSTGSQHGRVSTNTTNNNHHPRPKPTPFKAMTSVEGGGGGGQQQQQRRRTSKDYDDGTPPPTPPPRPPPPRQPPNLREMREKERILKRMTSMPAAPYRTAADSSRSAVTAADQRHLSMNGGRKLSLDQQYQRATRSFSTDVTASDPTLPPDQHVRTGGGSRGGGGGVGEEEEGKDTMSRRMEGVNLREDASHNSPATAAKVRPESSTTTTRDTAKLRGTGGGGEPRKNDATVAPTRRGGPPQGEKPQNRSDRPQNFDQTDPKNAAPANNKPVTTREGTRAPKFTTTKRRSSTVDEMLFDDYVEPTDDPVDAAFSPENLPQDLMSFETQEEKRSPGHAAAGAKKAGEDPPEDLHSPTSVDSSDAEYGDGPVPRSGSQMSDRSWSSNYSLDSQPDDVTVECMEFMKAFVDKVFNASEETSQVEKAKFGELCQYAPGRLWFSRYVNSQRVNNKRVTEETFFRLVQYMAVCLFECNEAEDFSPAKTLMNMCFTFYCDMPSPTGDDKSFLYMFLKEQPIWQSLRFWNAAFFDAVQCERSRRPMATNSAANDTMTDDRNFQENITFGQLGTFSCNMRSFGLSRELCLEFLRKQSTIANLSSEQVKLLRDNVDKMTE